VLSSYSKEISYTEAMFEAGTVEYVRQPMPNVELAADKALEAITADENRISEMRAAAEAAWGDAGAQ
jgi:hypothetical protein